MFHKYVNINNSTFALPKTIETVQTTQKTLNQLFKDIFSNTPNLYC